jgi:hypothetical protein
MAGNGRITYEHRRLLRISLANCLPGSSRSSSSPSGPEAAVEKTAHLLAGWGAMRAFSVPRHETGAPQAAMKPGSLRAR